MRILIDFFSNPIVLFSFMTIAALAIVTVVHFKINVASMSKDVAEKALTSRLKKDSEKHRKREQMTKIGKDESSYVKKYRMAVTSIKIAMGLSFLSIENFTTMFMLFGVAVWGICSFLLNNPFLGFLIAVPSIFALLAFLLVLTKKKIRANDNAVMDALDSICPTVNLGITNAIKSNMSSYNRKIKHHFEWFLGSIEFQGYGFNEAMDELAQRLGPRFDEFSHKAKIFDEHYKAGMEDIFKDIIEQNNDVRSDNSELDVLYGKKNQDMLMVAGLLVGFLIYMYITPLTSEFMIDTFWGTLLSAIVVSLLVLIYAINQFLQVDLPNVEKKGDR